MPKENRTTAQEFKDAIEFKNRLPRVVEVLDRETVVLNWGAMNDVRLGAKFQLFAFGDEITDPATGQSLGILEIPKGVGEIVSLQRKMCILTSSKRRERRSNWNIWDTISTDEVVPFRDVEIGDYARPI